MMEYYSDMKRIKPVFCNKRDKTRDSILNQIIQSPKDNIYIIFYTYYIYKLYIYIYV